MPEVTHPAVGGGQLRLSKHGVHAARAWFKNTASFPDGEVGDWRRFLSMEDDDTMREALRRHARTGRPLGDAAFKSGLGEPAGPCPVPRQAWTQAEENGDISCVSPNNPRRSILGLFALGNLGEMVENNHQPYQNHEDKA